MAISNKYKKIWELALPYLKKGKRKNFVVHTEGVVKAMEMILKEIMLPKDIMIPTAILHDVGWSKVPVKLQKNWKNKIDKKKSEKMHLEYSAPIVEKILKKLKYDPFDIYTIVRIIKSHQFKVPENIMEEALMDADNLSDIFHEQFYTDVKEYNVSAGEQLEFRSKNKFYSKTAQKIFDAEFKKRTKEIKK